MKLAHLGWKSSHTLMGQRRPSSWPPPIPLCSLATLRPGALSSKGANPDQHGDPFSLTVTSTQCRSGGCSAPSLAPGLASVSSSRSLARRPGLLTRRMLMSFSQQNAWMRVKWICRATSLSSSSSAASRQSTTLSGSLRAAGGAGERRGTTSPGGCPQHPPRSARSPWGRHPPTRRLKNSRKRRCRARSGPRGRPPGVGVGGGAGRDARGPHLHIEQLSRLVHPDRDGALTQGFAQHFLQGIPHIIHPARRPEKGVPSVPVPRGCGLPLPLHRDPPSRVHEPLRISAFCKPPTPPHHSWPLEAGSPGRSPKSATRHPPPRALPVPGAGRWQRMPAAGAAPARRVLLPFARARKGSAGLGGHALFVRGHPWEGPRGRKMRGTLCKLLHAHSTASLPQPGSTGVHSGPEFRERLRPPYLSVFGSPAENSSKVILQLQVPHRERAAGQLLHPRARGRRLGTPSQAPPAPAATAQSAPPAGNVRPSPPGSTLSPTKSRATYTSAASQPLKDKGPRVRELSCQPPANHLQPHLHTRSHWAMQISIGDNLTPAPGTRLRSGRGRSCAEASPGCGGGAGIRRAGPWADTSLWPGLQDRSSLPWRGVGTGCCLQLGLELAAKCFSSWCTFFFYCSFMSFVFRGCY